MALYAVDNVGDALETTKEFLTPIKPITWVKLAVIVFFIGLSGANTNFFQFGTSPSGNGTTTEPTPTPDLGPDAWLLIGVVVVGLLLIALVVAFIAAVMEFVFVESLRSETVAIRRYWSRRWRQGVRLLAFRIGLGLVALAGGVLLVLFVVVLAALDIPALLVLAALIVLPIILLGAILVALIDGFTTTFVVPIMILTGDGVLDGWRRLWPTIIAQWKQYLAYVVVALLLSIAIGIAATIVVFLLTFLLLIPFAVLFGIGFALFTVADIAGIAFLAITGILFVGTIVAVSALVNVPVQTYLRYYALLVLGDVNDEFDVIPQLRASVREADSIEDDQSEL